MGIFVIATIIYLIINMALLVIDAIRRIVTEEDYVMTWKEKAVADIIALVIDLVLVLGLALGW